MTQEPKSQLGNLQIEIKYLSSLQPIEYELERFRVAEKFKIRVNELDRFVESERRLQEEDKSETVLFRKIEPWHDAVCLDDLLHDIVQDLNRYVSFNSEHELIAIALWIIHTYCIKIAYISPILFVTSAEMRCGKSTLLSILQKLLFKCVAASSVSPSAIYRLIPKYRPTFIFDEADTYFTEKNEALRGVINAGHSRDTSGILLTNPETLEVERFDAFGAKCIAAIKGLPGTIEDRSIIIKMHRINKGQKKEKMRLMNEDIRKQLYIIQQKCLRFANDNLLKLKTIEPSIPETLNDRAADNWHPLLQIVALAGKGWQDAAIKAALSLSGVEQENKSLGVELLEDIFTVLNEKCLNYNYLTTSELIDALCKDEEAPWATYNNKRQDARIGARQLSKLLSPYGIKSTNVGPERNKGYFIENFNDAFNRYIPSQNQNISAHSAQSAQTLMAPAFAGEIKNESHPLISAHPLRNIVKNEPRADMSGSERINNNPQKDTEGLSSVGLSG